MRRLERRLARERAARMEAETITERALRDLYDKQQGLVLLETVAKAANEASSIDKALRIALQAVSAHSSWPIAHAWTVGAEGNLVSTEIWTGETDRFAGFQAASRELVFRSGEGLPGRALAERAAVWVTDQRDLATLPRGAAILEAGLQTALCFPLFALSEVVGVLEFWSERLMEPDPELLALMSQIGTQLGRVVERQRAVERLGYQATHDALTGLPNRVLILDHLRQALSRQARGEDEHTAVFFVDLDGFKTVNDAQGHSAGDRLLRQVATRLSAAIRPHDTLGRLGGDEFVIVCEGLTEEYRVATIADRMSEALRDSFELDGEQFLITASVGIAMADATNAQDPEALIEQADAAMYRSKELGRARYEVFSEELHERIARRLEIERALRNAIERDEMCLHFQPEVDLRDGAIVGVEALVRWQRPGGMVMPSDFIPLAEETGLIVGIGAWVLDAALRQSAEWMADPAIVSVPWTAVNLSVRQLIDPDLMKHVSRALERYGADPARLFLEVTESVILDDAEAGLTVLTGLRSLGSEIAIDDFGTGYASLSYLRRFPASVVKVDQSFIAEIATDDRARAIASAIVSMARALNLSAVAEGIETPEQLAVVRQIGFDIGQGYVFARPGLAADLAPLLRHQRPFAGLISDAS